MGLKTIQAAIEHHLSAHQLSLTQFSELSGLNTGTLSNILNGHRLLSVGQLDRITAAMGLPEGSFYDRYAKECLRNAPDWRRFSPFLQRCAELGRTEIMEPVVRRMLDNLAYGALLFEMAERFFEEGRLEAAALLYQNVSESEKYQHSERLALCQFRLFNIEKATRQRQDKDALLRAATKFEGYLERLDELDQVAALLDLADVYSELERWSKVEQLAEELERKASAQYTLLHKAARRTSVQVTQTGNKPEWRTGTPLAPKEGQEIGPGPANPEPESERGPKRTSDPERKQAPGQAFPAAFPQEEKRLQQAGGSCSMPLFGSILYSYRLRAVAHEKRGSYAEALHYISLCTGAGWIKESGEEVRHFLMQLEEWAEGERLACRMLAGEREVLPLYADYWTAKQPFELLPAVHRMLQAANHYGYDLDELLEAVYPRLEGYALEALAAQVTNQEPDQKPDSGKKLPEELAVSLFAELALYEFRKERYAQAIVHLLKSLEGAVRMDSSSGILRCVALFEQYRGYAGQQALKEYRELITEMVRQKEIKRCIPMSGA